MPEQAPEAPPKFDAYADEYRALLETSIQESGESAEYFAEYKLTEQLVREYRSVTAYEPSAQSLEHARKRAPDATCVSVESDLPGGHFSTAVCAGVIHHIPPAERHGVLTRLRSKLRPGGRLFIFEHNPLNPLTRRAVAMCAFDDDAVLLWPWQLRPLLRGAGFEVDRVDYIVFFPRALARLRPLEPYLRHVVLGAQTLTVATNPG